MRIFYLYYYYYLTLMDQKKVPTHMHCQDIYPRSYPPFTHELLSFTSLTRYQYLLYISFTLRVCRFQNLHSFNFYILYQTSVWKGGSASA